MLVVSRKSNHLIIGSIWSASYGTCGVLPQVVLEPTLTYLVGPKKLPQIFAVTVLSPYAPDRGSPHPHVLLLYDLFCILFYSSTICSVSSPPKKKRCSRHQNGVSIMTTLSPHVAQRVWVPDRWKSHSQPTPLIGPYAIRLMCHRDYR